LFTLPLVIVKAGLSRKFLIFRNCGTYRTARKKAPSDNVATTPVTSRSRAKVGTREVTSDEILGIISKITYQPLAKLVSTNPSLEYHVNGFSDCHRS